MRIVDRIATRIDTWGGSAKARRFRDGWPAQTSPGVLFHDTGLVQYRYRMAGAGQTIIFTVDPPMTLEVYSPLIELFARHFRVVVVELPAMGFSVARAAYGFGFRETNNDLAGFIRAVCGPQCIFAFSCVASLAAIDIAHRQPDLASHLCLLQAGGVEAFARWKAGRDPKGILARPIMGQLVMKRMAPKRMPQWYGLSVGRKDQIGHFCTCAERSFEHGAMWSLASAYQLYMNLTEELPRPNQPILSVWGKADRSHPEGNAHTLAQLYPDVRCVTLDTLGHTPELEDPAAVLGAITTFLAVP
jgi:pimeloyl-ACP methyl ester carboxylesterase